MALLVKGVIPGAIVKASLNRAILCHTLDPKPGELPMDRLKFIERWMEGRTHACCKMWR
jgi:hypothetical protein